MVPVNMRKLVCTVATGMQGRIGATRIFEGDKDALLKAANVFPLQWDKKVDLYHNTPPLDYRRGARAACLSRLGKRLVRNDTRSTLKQWTMRCVARRMPPRPTPLPAAERESSLERWAWAAHTVHRSATSVQFRPPSPMETTAPREPHVN